MTTSSGSAKTTGKWSDRYATVVIRARWLVIAGWVALLFAALFLPPLARPNSNAGADIIPPGSPALLAEQRSVEQFGRPPGPT